MCWCNPSIRTPNCGSINCHPPSVPINKVEIELPDGDRRRVEVKARELKDGVLTLYCSIVEAPVFLPAGNISCPPNLVTTFNSPQNVNNVCIDNPY